MGSERKELEIIYNLQWKNIPSENDDKANVVGMYDIPATTLNWETFKFYLLKNSGVTGDDVKVSYLGTDDKEFPIESQLDFQIALYLFRQKARNNEIITLKLDRISDQFKMIRNKRVRRPQNLFRSFAVARPDVVKKDEKVPPEWFVQSMQQFKEDIIQEVTDSVVNTILPSLKVQGHASHVRKSKPETKRARKVLLHPGEGVNEKELIKSLKLERKLDNKLEKLEHKTFKIKEKKMALSRPGEDIVRNTSKSRLIGMPITETESLMDASPVGLHDTTIPHMSGGETYQQEWEVVNTGKLPWTADTELRYAWGSESLKPVGKNVTCPKLSPGEKGTVSVYLEIPKKPGNYECYWHFYHEGYRFGHWLGCQVIVDDPLPLKLQQMFQRINDGITIEETVTEFTPESSWCSNKKPKMNHCQPEPEILNNEINDTKEKCTSTSVTESEIFEPPNPFDKVTDKETINFLGEWAQLQNLKLQSSDTPDVLSSDSDNQSIISIADSNSSLSSCEEFVLVPMPSCFKVDEPESKPTDLENAGQENAVNIEIKLENVENDPPPSNTTKESDDNNNTEEAINVSDSSSESIIEIKSESRHSLETLPCGIKYEPGADSNMAAWDNNDDNYDHSQIIKKMSELQFKCSLEDITSVNDTVTSEPDMITEFLKTQGGPRGYAYVTINGQKTAVPKQVLRADYLVTAEEAPHPPVDSGLKIVDENLAITSNADVGSSTYPLTNVKTTNSVYVSAETTPASSHCSIQANNCNHLEKTNCPNNSRLFVFPQSCPGFEVVYPECPSLENQPTDLVDGENKEQEVPRSSASSTQQSFSYSTQNPWWSHYSNASMDGQCDRSMYGCSTPTNNSHHCHGNGVHYSYQHGMGETSHSYHQGCNVNGQNMHQHYGFNVGNCQCNGHFSQRRFNCTPVNMPAHAETESPASTFCQPSETSQSSVSSEPLNRATAPPLNTSTDMRNIIPQSVQILPEALVTGAVNVASSAVNTARSVLNMFVPTKHDEAGRWVNGHWVPNGLETPRERALRTLQEMGFWDRDLNATLLARYNDDLTRVISELVQYVDM